MSLTNNLHKVVPFDRLFAGVRPFTGADVNSSVILTERRHNIGHYMVLNCGGYIAGLWVQPTEEVIEHVNDNMLVITGDRLHFQLCAYDAGEPCRAWVKYGQIIGSRELPRVAYASLPPYIVEKLREVIQPLHTVQTGPLAYEHR